MSLSEVAFKRRVGRLFRSLFFGYIPQLNAVLINVVAMRFGSLEYKSFFVFQAYLLIVYVVANNSYRTIYDFESPLEMKCLRGIGERVYIFFTGLLVLGFYLHSELSELMMVLACKKLYDMHWEKGSVTALGDNSMKWSYVLIGGFELFFMVHIFQFQIVSSYLLIPYGIFSLVLLERVQVLSTIEKTTNYSAYLFIVFVSLLGMFPRQVIAIFGDATDVNYFGKTILIGFFVLPLLTIVRKANFGRNFGVATALAVLSVGLSVFVLPNFYSLISVQYDVVSFGWIVMFCVFFALYLGGLYDWRLVKIGWRGMVNVVNFACLLGVLFVFMVLYFVEGAMVSAGVLAILISVFKVANVNRISKALCGD